MKTRFVSNCCGASPKSNGDMDTMDLGICPDCKEHCTYICEECEQEECICGNRDFSAYQESIIANLSKDDGNNQ